MWVFYIMKRILFYPYKTEYNSYVGMMRCALSKHYHVSDYVENKDYIDDSIAVIYLNWIEDVMDEEDREILSKAKLKGIKIIWVFHNKVSHNKDKQKYSLDNIKFLINISTNIIIHSHNSRSVLENYGLSDVLKVVYIPHPEFINNYGYIKSDEVLKKIENKKCVFGFIGNVREDKNALLSIKAFKQMKYKDECLLLISGKASNMEYSMRLINEIDGDDNILFENEKVKNYMVNFYIDISDIILMPYDTASCMNSGVMMLAFSNKKTVITTDISMAMDYSDELIFRYKYTDNQKEHLETLIQVMEKVYEEGRDNLNNKGTELYKDILTNNSKQLVENMLIEMIGKTEDLYKGNCYLENLKKDAIRKRGRMYAAFLNEIMEESHFIDNLGNDEQLSIAIYAWGKMGQYVWRLLKYKGVEISCVIDQNENIVVDEIPVYSLNNLKMKLDVVIVTTHLADMQQIKRVCLANNPYCTVLDLEDLE